MEKAADADHHPKTEGGFKTGGRVLPASGVDIRSAHSTAPTISAFPCSFMLGVLMIASFRQRLSPFRGSSRTSELAPKHIDPIRDRAIESPGFRCCATSTHCLR